MQLAECLQSTPLRTLLALCQANGFACDRHAPKSALVTLLVARLTTRSRPAYLTQLPPDQLALLHALAQQIEPTPLAPFQARFGQIRPYRPWRKDGPLHPWRSPVSSAEALVYRGLIFVLRAAGQSPVVVLPDEIAAALRQPQPAPPPLAPAPTIATSLLDLALLLAYLRQVDVRPLHGRWLSPQHCQRLGSYLAPPLPAAPLPSQRHSLRLAFAHYLAERLQLLTGAAGLLKPSPGADAWLDQSPTELIRACWQTWLAPDDANRELWRRFRLPGCTLRDPVGFARRLIDHLALASWGNLTDLLPWWEREQGDDALRTHVQDLFSGPLAGLGLVAAAAALDAAAPPLLTPLGAWLIRDQEAAPPLNAPQPLTSDADLALTLPAGAPPSLAAILSLAPWADLEPGPRLRITPVSLARALGQGGELPGLWALWRRFVAPPLSQPQQARLLAWAGALRWVELRPALLLHTPSAADLDALWADRALRPHLGQRLAGDLASIRSSDPDRLRRALAARGYAVRAVASPQPEPAGSEMSLAAGDRWWLYTSSLIHRLLAERLGLAAPPGAVLAALQATLGPAEQAAAWAAADAAGAALHTAIDGLPDPSASLPLEQVEQRLLAAIDANDTVRMVYWSPWQQETTERCVQPLVLQWRGDHRYLLAHCRTANAPRTFRLDRILALTACSPS